MNYSSHYQQQTYDSSSLTQQIYNQPANDYYAYSYPDPQYTSVQPYSYPNLTVQPSQHEQQEPHPPGVTAPPPLPPHQDQSSYFQYHAHSAAAAVFPVGPQHGGVDSGVRVVHQPIVQSSYGGFSIVNGVAPPGAAQTHLSPQPNVRGRPYRVRGRGRGRVMHKHAATRDQERTVSTHGGSRIRGEPLPPIVQPYASSFGPISTPIHGPAHIMPALPPPRIAWCELCRVDCNTLDILEQHKNGKKHKKKLKVFEELQNLNSRVIGGQMEQTSSQLKPEVPLQPDQIEQSEKQIQQESLPSQAINEESKVAVENRELEEAEPIEEPGKKMIDHSEGLTRGLKRKMRGGKVGRRMRPCDRPKRTVEPPKPKEVIPLVCELCNVKCESPIVFQSHLAGKKHKSKAKRFLGQQEPLEQEVLPALRPVSQDANASTSVAFHPQVLCNEKTVKAQASTVETNVKSTKLEAAVSQPQALAASSGAKILVNIAGISEEGHPQSGAQGDCPVGGLVTKPVECVATTGTSEPATSQTTLDGTSI